VTPNKKPVEALARVGKEIISYDMVAEECVSRHGKEILDDLINRMVIQQACEAQNINVSEEEVTVEVNDDNSARITCGNSFFRILGLSPDDYPPPPRFEEVKEFKVSGFTLRDGLRKVAYAISTDETRYVLNGVYCQFKEGKLTLVATDGRRLAMTDADVEFPESQECSVIIPTKAVNELQRVLKEAGDKADVRIRIGPKRRLSVSAGSGARRRLASCSPSGVSASRSG
jgi:hypothetical protein